jgi:hypothetical protein
MGRTRILTVLMVSSALVLSAVSAQGGATFNRPDLLDVNDNTGYRDAVNSEWSWAGAYADDDWNNAFGSMSGSVRDANHRVRVYAQLYQPDTIKRNHRRAKMSQKRYVWVWVGLYTQPTDTLVDSHSTAIEDCRGAITADDRAANARDRDGIFNLDPAGDDTIRGRFKCPRGILSDLGFSPADIDTIQGLVGKRIQLKINLP